MFLLIDKPKGVTSHDVVDVIRGITGEKRVGHAGTLDPNATGLLIVGVGRDSTRKLGDLTKKTNKKYVADIFLGEERDTDDIEGQIVKKVIPTTTPDINVIRKTLDIFLGKQLQTPPAFSAIKVGGKKAYKEARKGKEIVLEPREIVVYSINLINYEYPHLTLKFSVSAGTYIRSLARDIGKHLGVGGYLFDLRRTRVGDFNVKDAVNLASLNKDNWKTYAILI